MSKLAPRQTHTSGYYSTDDDATVVKEHAKSLCGFSEMNCHCCGVSNRRIEGLLLQCAACRQAYYCSVDCFNQHLPHHAPFCRPAMLDQGPVGKMPAITVPSSPLVVTPHQASSTTEETAGILPVKTRYIDTSCSESETEPESVGRSRSRSHVTSTRQIPNLTKSPRRHGQKRPPRPSGTAGATASVASSTRSATALQALATARSSHHRTKPKPYENGTTTSTAGATASVASSTRSAAALQALATARSSHHRTKPKPSENGATTSSRRGGTPSVYSSDESIGQGNENGDGLPRVVTPTQCYGFANGNAQVPSEDEWDEETWEDSFDGDESQGDDDADEWEEETVTTQQDGEEVSTTLETSTRRSGGGVIPQWKNGSLNSSPLYKSTHGTETTAAPLATTVERSIQPRVQRSFIDASCSESETETESMAAERRVSRRQRRCGKRQTQQAGPVTTTVKPLDTTNVFQSSTTVVDRTIASDEGKATDLGPFVNPCDLTSSSKQYQGSTDEADDASFTNDIDVDGKSTTTKNAPYAQFRLDRSLHESHASLVSGAPSVTMASQTDTETLSDMDLLSLREDVAMEYRHKGANILSSGVKDQAHAIDAGTTPFTVPERVDREIEHSQVYRGGGNLNLNDGSETQKTEVVLIPVQRIQSNVDWEKPEWISESLHQRGDKPCETRIGTAEDRAICDARDLADVGSMRVYRAVKDSSRDSTLGTSNCMDQNTTPSSKKEEDNAINQEEVDIEQTRFLRGGGLLNQHVSRSPEKVSILVTRGVLNDDTEVISKPTLRQSSKMEASETKGETPLESNTGNRAAVNDDYEYGHELNFTTEDCISEYDDYSSSYGDFDFIDRRGPTESTYPKQQRRYSMDSADDMDIVVSRLRYGGGYMGSPGNVRQTRRHSASVCLRPTNREKQSYPWARPEWVLLRLRKVKRNDFIRAVTAGPNWRQEDSTGSLTVGAKLPHYSSGLSSPIQATRTKQTIEWEKPQWVESRLRSTSPERKLDGKISTPNRVHGAKPEWIQGKSELKPTTNGRKLKRMGTFREELKRERIDRDSVDLEMPRRKEKQRQLEPLYEAWEEGSSE